MDSTVFSDSNAGIQLENNHGTINFSSDGLEDPQKKRDNALLRSLAFPEMLARRDNIEPCHTNTCQWILELDEYKSWLEEPCGLLWVKGKPGAGKSTLMAFLHDRLKESHDGIQGIIRLDFFFSARGTELQRTQLGMLRSLLNQLFDRDETIRPAVREIYDKRCRQFGYGEQRWEWPQAVLEQLLRSAILSSAKRQHVTLFVDALDETGSECAQRLADLFHTLVSEARKADVALQVCFSSRHYPNIRRIEAAGITVEHHNQSDIALYIKDSLVDIEVGDDSSQETKEALVLELTQHANGLFQWIHLVMPFITRQLTDTVPIDEIRDWLRKVPADLEEVYVYILNNVIEEWNWDQSLLLFQWVCLAQRPLTVTEMRYALAARNARTTSPPREWEKINGFIKSDQDMKQKIKALTGGLAEVVSGGNHQTVQVVHQSVNDFLHEKGLALLLHRVSGSKAAIDESKIHPQCHATIYRSCLVYLVAASQKREIRDFKSEKDLVRAHPFLRYVTINIFLHAEKAACCRADLLTKEEDLLQQVISLWIWVYQLFDKYGTSTPSTGTTVLHMAAASNMVDIMKSMLSNSEEIERADTNGNTAFHFAGRAGQTTAGELLLGKGADREKCNDKGATPLVEAAGCGQLGFVEWLVAEGAELQTIGASPLYTAALYGQNAVVELLLNAGADVNAQGGEYGNALQAAAIQPKNLETVKILLNAGADVNAQGGYFSHALQAAGYNGHPETVKILLDAGADVNAQGGYLSHALQAAGCSGNPETVKILLDAGADVNARGGTYGNALQAAAIQPKNLETVKILLNAGADVNAQGGYFSHALQAAGYSGNPETVKILLDAGADVNAQGSEYGNALQAAGWGGNPQTVKILLNASADVNAQGGKYSNALQAAGLNGNPETVKILLDAGADVNAQGGKYGNALQAAAAAESRNTEKVKLLLDAGADINAQGGIHGSPLLAAIYSCDVDTVQVFLQRGANTLHSDKLGQTPLHIAASRDFRACVSRFAQSASAINKYNTLSETPLHLALSHGHIEFARKLLHFGADPSLLDGFGRNAIDWAFGDDALIQEIRARRPSLTSTPNETQQLIAQQSILRLSNALPQLILDYPWPIIVHLARYILFLDDTKHALHLLQIRVYLSGTKILLKPVCNVCTWEMTETSLVCSICAYMHVCIFCKGQHTHRKLDRNREDVFFEVPELPDNEAQVFEAGSEELTDFVSHLVSEHLRENSIQSGTEPSNDSPPSLVQVETAPVSNPTLKLGIIISALIGVLAVLFGVWRF